MVGAVNGKTRPESTMTVAQEEVDTWQSVPSLLTELLADPDREKSQRVMQARR